MRVCRRGERTHSPGVAACLHLSVPGQVSVCTSVPVGSPCTGWGVRMLTCLPGRPGTAKLRLWGLCCRCNSCCLALGKLWGPDRLWVGSETRGLGVPGLTAVLLGLCLCSGDTDTQKSRVPRDPELHPQYPLWRPGSPRQSPTPTMALCRGVNQGSAWEAVTRLPCSSRCPRVPTRSLRAAGRPSQQPGPAAGVRSAREPTLPPEGLPPHPGCKRQKRRQRAAFRRPRVRIRQAQVSVRARGLWAICFSTPCLSFPLPPRGLV